MANLYNQHFHTNSGEFNIYFSPSRKDAMPDVTEFFRLFGLRLFAGWIDRSDSQCPDMSYSLFRHLNQYFVRDRDPVSPWEAGIPVPHGLVTAYYTKEVYWADPTGESWHTPLTAHFIKDHDKFFITKGWNKIMAAELAGINKLPVISSCHDKFIPRPGMKIIKNDSMLRDFVDVISKNQAHDPEIGIDFLRFDTQTSLPVIHYLDITRQAAERPGFPGMFSNDQRIWKRWYPGRLVVSDVLPTDNDIGYDHKKLTGVHPDLEHIRRAMPPEAVAYICSDRNPDICARLTEALVWLSSDRHGHKVGEVRSIDGRYRIVYNNNCDDLLIMPPGLYK
jgi:hypothetical protein